MGAISKLRKGFDMKSPTNFKSDNGKGTSKDKSNAVKVKSSGTAGTSAKTIPTNFPLAK